MTLNWFYLVEQVSVRDTSSRKAVSVEDFSTLCKYKHRSVGLKLRSKPTVNCGCKLSLGLEGLRKIRLHLIVENRQVVQLGTRFIGRALQRS